MEKYKDRFEHGHFSFSDFQEVASLVSSRAFFVAKHHGQSLVPFADVFNHKCAMVVMDKEHELEGDSSDADSQSSRDCDLSDIPLEHRLEICICTNFSHEFQEKGLEIRAAQFIPKRQEIHNTYGELDNEELLHKYGFCIEGNIFDSVAISSELLMRHIQRSIPETTFTNRHKVLQSTLESMETVISNFKLFSQMKMSNSLLMILRLFFCSEDEFQSALQALTETELDDPSASVDAKHPDLPDQAWICFRDVLCELEKTFSKNRIPGDRVIVLLEGKCMLLNAFIKWVSILVSQGLHQDSKIMSNSMMSDNQTKSTPSSMSSSINKRKFIQIWCMVDD